MSVFDFLQKLEKTGSPLQSFHNLISLPYCCENEEISIFSDLLECYLDRSFRSKFDDYFDRNDGDDLMANRFLVMRFDMKGYGYMFFDKVIMSMGKFLKKHKQRIFLDNDDDNVQKDLMTFLQKKKWMDAMDLIFTQTSKSNHKIFLILDNFNLDPFVQKYDNGRKCTRANDHLKFLNFVQNRGMTGNQTSVISRSLILCKNTIWANAILLLLDDDEKKYTTIPSECCCWVWKNRTWLNYQNVKNITRTILDNYWEKNDNNNDGGSPPVDNLASKYFPSIIDSIMESEILTEFFPQHELHLDPQTSPPNDDDIQEQIVIEANWGSCSQSMFPIERSWRVNLMSGENTLNAWTYLLWSDGLLEIMTQTLDDNDEKNHTIMFKYKNSNAHQWLCNRWKEPRTTTANWEEELVNRYTPTTITTTINNDGYDFVVDECLFVNQSFNNALQSAMRGQLNDDCFMLYLKRWMMGCLCQKNDTMGANELSFKCMLLGLLSASPVHSILSEFRQIDLMMEICPIYRHNVLYKDCMDVIIELKRIPLQKLFIIPSSKYNTTRSPSHRQLSKMDFSNTQSRTKLGYYPFQKSTTTTRMIKKSIDTLIQLAAQQIHDYWDDLKFLRRENDSMMRPVGWVVIALGWSNLIIEKIELEF